MLQRVGGGKRGHAKAYELRVGYLGVDAVMNARIDARHVPSVISFIVQLYEAVVGDGVEHGLFRIDYETIGFRFCGN